jgi:cysteine desulfurase
VQRIYLDNNATTALMPEVLEAMAPYLTGTSGNASSLHQEGRRARKAIETAREQIAELLHAKPAQVIFTSGGTEANNLAIFGLAGQDPARVATSTIEHPSIQACFELLKNRGFHVDKVPVDRLGLVDINSFQTVVEQRPRVIAIMLANNETGAIQPVAKIANGARTHDVLFHTDAIQFAGKLPLSFHDLDVTSMSISAHKFHGPGGVGALIVKSTKAFHPVFAGGHQEFGVRPGTEPTGLIVGMAAALSLAVKNLEMNVIRMRNLANQLIEGLQRLARPVIMNGSDDRLPHTVNLQFPQVDAQTAVVALDLAGVACSTGSACASGAPTTSPTLLAMGLDREQARSSIRFSLSRFTTEQEIEQAITIIAKVVMKLRRPAAQPVAVR